MTTQVRTGRCYCGKVRYSVHGEVRSTCVCHCESCRRAAGAAYVAWGTVDDDCLRVLCGALQLHSESAQVERGFCGSCGTSLTYRHASRAGEVDFTLVTLDDLAALNPQMHVWVQDKLPWIRLADGLPQYATVPSDGQGPLPIAP